jgi:hypothetical protein
MPKVKRFRISKKRPKISPDFVEITIAGKRIKNKIGKI